MIATRLLLGLATAGVFTLLAGVSPEPANAQNVMCKDSFTASGRGKFRPFTKTKELEGRGSAMADAVANWQREVAAKYGEKWKNWSDAREASFTCAPTKDGKIIGSSFIGCTISGRPCSTDRPREGGPIVLDIHKHPRDLDRDRPRRSRYLDREARIYAWEMARQDRLAAYRARSESRAWERENAYQRYLEKQRERRERRMIRWADYEEDYYY